MKITSPDIACFAIIKANLLLDEKSNSDNVEERKNNIYDDAKKAFETLERLAFVNHCTVEEAVDECLNYFNKPQELEDNFFGAYKVVCKFINLDEIFGGRAKKVKEIIKSSSEKIVDDKQLEQIKRMILFFD